MLKILIYPVMDTVIVDITCYSHGSSIGHNAARVVVPAPSWPSGADQLLLTARTLSELVATLRSDDCPFELNDECGL